MSDLIEQYQQAAAMSAGYMYGRMVPEMTTAGLINAKLEDDGPIFSKQKINFNPGDNITHLVVCSNQLALGMRNKMRRIDLKHPENFEDTDFKKLAGDKAKISEIFLDPAGKHYLISLKHSESQAPLENVYLHQNSKKPQLCPKMKGHVISAVAWNFLHETENSTGSILVGTTKGLIFETELAFGDERTFFQSNPEQFWKMIYDVNANCIKLNITSSQATSITGLAFHKLQDSDTYVVFATTPSLIMEFIGNVGTSDPPIFYSVFENFMPGDLLGSVIQLPGNLGYSKLQLFYPQPKAFPKSFAWMTEPGVYYCELKNKLKKGENSFITYQKLLSYGDENTEGKSPLFIVLTEFHVLIVFRDRIKILNVLDEKLVYEDVFTELYGSLLGIYRDPVQGTIWAYSEMAIYRYKVFREDRNVWEIYLQKGEYELAKRYCKSDAIKMDKVLLKQADDLFRKESYGESAELYAKTYSSFEEIALKFLEAEQEEALKTFLMTKLRGFKSQDKTQITMTILWLFEIFLNQLGILRNSGRQHTDVYLQLETQFRGLLEEKEVKMCVADNRSAVYKLMTSHGDEENLIFFTVLMKDYEKVIQYHLQRKDHVAALEVLTKQSKAQLFYHFSPVLIQFIPQQLVNAWIAQERRLNPVLLIPALVQYDHPSNPKQANQAIRYLEYCVYKMECAEQSVHNYLLALYARQQPDKLMTYLELQGQDPEIVIYDQKFALRLCAELSLDKACVHIYTTMGLYEEAVDLALKFDIDLAKQNADRPEDNEDLKKKLWLKIAKHVVEVENDIKRAMEFLQECNLIKIEDILPFFPDFVTIDHFKDAICMSLQAYNQHIEGLKEEMKEATQSAEEIRMEIQAFRSRYNMVKAAQKCSACSYPIMTRTFYLFPCRHMFHSDCLIEEVKPNLTSAKRSRIADIQRQLGTLAGREDTTSISSASIMSAAISSKDKLCAELDDLVASECIYCGDIMIRSIDEPFIPMDQYADILKSWE